MTSLQRLYEWEKMKKILRTCLIICYFILPLSVRQNKARIINFCLWHTFNCYSAIKIVLLVIVIENMLGNGRDKTN